MLAMHCRKCHYDLRGLAELRCPECGTEFDPSRPETFLEKLPRQAGPVERAAGVVFVAIILGSLIAVHLTAQMSGH
jgi:hypothetical protein